MSQAEPPDNNLPPLSDEEEAALLGALEAALRPGPLAAAVNERLLEMALEDPLAPPSEAEVVASERLRRALEAGTPHEDASLLQALRFRSTDASDSASIERALGRALPPEKPRRNVIFAVFGGGGVVAAAAAALLFLTTQARAPEATLAQDSYARPRSTAPLFSERFDTESTTARMDAIASARSRDLRDNRYAAWGIR